MSNSGSSLAVEKLKSTIVVLEPVPSSKSYRMTVWMVYCVAGDRLLNSLIDGLGVDSMSVAPLYKRIHSKTAELLGSYK